jgi:hypothetical protein
VFPERSLEDDQCFLDSGLLLYSLGEAQDAEHQALVPLTPVQRGIDVPAPRVVAPPRWDVRRAALVARTAVSSIHLRRAMVAILRRASDTPNVRSFGLRLGPVDDVTVEISFEGRSATAGPSQLVEARVEHSPMPDCQAGV